MGHEAWGGRTGAGRRLGQPRFPGARKWVACSASGNLRLGHGWRQARTVSGCVKSAFLNISQHFTAHLFSPWIPSSARHRRWTPMIHRGRARRRIGVRPTGGLQVTSQRSAAGGLAVADDERVGRPSPNEDLRSGERRVRETLAEQAGQVVVRLVRRNQLRTSRRRFCAELEHLGVQVDDDRLGLEGAGGREFL